MRTLTILFLLLGTFAHAQQSNIAHVSVWLPKTGHELNFENGYKQHLKWHAANNDRWDWYGWYVISGDRTGHFIDATFGHAWSDYGNPVNAAGDRADNNLHTAPFGNFVKAYKIALVPELSTGDSMVLKANFLRIVTIVTSDMEMAKSVYTKLKSKYANLQSPGYLVYKVVDGGNLNEWQLLIGNTGFASFAAYENFREDLNAIERSMKIQTIQSVKVETLRYREDMSLFAK